jgi:hypothetical protein
MLQPLMYKTWQHQFKSESYNYTSVFETAVIYVKKTIMECELTLESIARSRYIRTVR